MSKLFSVLTPTQRSVSKRATHNDLQKQSQVLHGTASNSYCFPEFKKQPRSCAGKLLYGFMESVFSKALGFIVGIVYAVNRLGAALWAAKGRI